MLIKYQNFAYLNGNVVLSPFRERPIGPGGTTGETQRDFYPARHFFSGNKD
jgi:hypothetical protein